MQCRHKIREGLTGKVTNDYFANTSVHVTYTSKLLMCTFLKYVPRILQEKIHSLLLFYQWVCFTFVCLVVVSGSHMITSHFTFFSSVSVYVADLLKTLSCCKIYMYYLFLNNRVSLKEKRILKIKLYMCMCADFPSHISSNCNYLSHFHVFFWLLFFDLQ